MNRVSHQFFAGAGFTFDQHRHGRRADAFDDAVDFLNRGRMSDHLIAPVRRRFASRAPRRGRFKGSRAVSQATLERTEQLFDAKRLQYEIGGADAYRSDRGV